MDILYRYGYNLYIIYSTLCNRDDELKERKNTCMCRETSWEAIIISRALTKAVTMGGMEKGTLLKDLNEM